MAEAEAEVILASLAGPTETSAEGSLVERFAQQRDEAAFAALVERYGPQVLGLCRRVLQNQQDAEDAFQATFLVLARKADTIHRCECVGSWLYSVAYRIARQARAKRARLPVPEPNPPEIAVADATPDLLWRDLRPILDEEVARLSPKYREPFYLCYFEGKTNEEAATELGCPLGTVLSRLSRAREHLRARLKRRGITLSAALLISFLAGRELSAAVPPGLAQDTVRKALLDTGGKAFAASAIPESVVMLADGFLANLRRARLRRAASGLLATATCSVAVLLLFLLLFLLLADRKTDQERIQGAWKATRTSILGGTANDGGSEMTFQGNRFTLDCKVFGPNAPSFQDEGTFELHPDQSPKAIDFISFRGGRTPGIYQFDKDRLIICCDCAMNPARRPTEFVTQPNTLLIVYELRRQ